MNSIEEMLENYAIFGAGFSTRFLKTVGLHRIQRPLMDLKLWEDMSRMEQIEEFIHGITRSIGVVYFDGDSSKKMKKDMLDIALDPLHPFSKVYSNVLQYSETYKEENNVR